MKYQYYSANDFALDKNFRKWVLNPTEENTKFWNNWLKQHPDKQKEITEARQLIQTVGLPADTEASTAFLEVWGHVQANAQQQVKKSRMEASIRYTRMAAIWIGFILLAGYLFWKVDEPTGPVTHTTGFGEVKKITLADGSLITLNANSSIRLTEGNWANAETRAVFLTGEAFFEVAKTKDKKSFTVTTADSILVQVLGTEFNVNTRREKTAVYLQSGKVQLKSTATQLVMKPGDFARYTKKDKKLKVEQIKEESQLAWKNNLFVFDDTPLLDIAQELEDTYGIKVHISDESLAQKRFTAKVPRKKVDVLLNVLAETLQVDIIRHTNKVQIRPRGGSVK
jgi:ferric-dicitrate binding protein FerR (iron transport regulator)